MGVWSVNLDEVKTESDANRYKLEKCSYQSQVVGLYTYVGGILAIPVLLKKLKIYPMSWEYRLGIGAATSLIASYYAAKICKSMCETKAEKELQGIVQV